MCEARNGSAIPRARHEHRDQLARHEGGGLLCRGQFFLLGCAALAWLILRSGTKPSRLAYPCQQSSFTMAAAVFGMPLIAATMRGRDRAAGMFAIHKKYLALVLLAAGGLAIWSHASSVAPPAVSALPPPDYRATVYSVPHARGTEFGGFGGVDDLVKLMGTSGLKWHRSAIESVTSGAEGMIDADDVVLIKINAQWPERGGTNTDLLRGIVRAVVDHPEGFVGEVVVADNGQGYGDLDRSRSNAEDITQSVWDVVRSFQIQGWAVSAQLWDSMRAGSVREYAEGDTSNGYVVDGSLNANTQIRASYPKFQTSFDTYISYKHGVWDNAAHQYDAGKLVVINVPVLKTHSIYGVTAAVKNHMGVVTQSLGTDSHSGVGRGGLGTILAEVRMPDLTILDCLWVLARPGSGPGASYTQASRRDQLVASRDPVALDVWSVKSILIPEIVRNGYSDFHAQDPDDPSSTFRNYLDRSMNQLLGAGIDTTNDVTAVDVMVWAGDFDRDGDVDLADAAEFVSCVHGPGEQVDAPCTVLDSDDDADLDLRDWARALTVFREAS